jgi:ribonuclease HII
MRSLPAIDRFAFERELLRQGVTRIAGVDEAGRGPLAGPVVAAAAMLPLKWMESRLPRGLRGLNDSKQLTRQQRGRFYQELTSCGEVLFAVARIEAGQVDEFNILQATHRAMNDALAGLLPSPEHVLVDGLRVKTLHFVHTPIIGGDALSYSIAAASVLAKVTRDRLMEEYHQRWPAYGFAEHKGYGTPRHLAALAKHGPCPIHRRSFSPIRQPEAELF